MGQPAAQPLAKPPVDQPYAGLQPLSDFPLPVWVESGTRSVWLEARRDRYSPQCGPPPESLVTDWCGFPAQWPWSNWVPARTKAALRVKAGDTIRFHLPEAPATRPTLRVGQQFDRQERTRRTKPGRAFTLGAGEAPWWRVSRSAHSGYVSLRIETGEYWLKLSIGR
jgi:hypothetical protein